MMMYCRRTAFECENTALDVLFQLADSFFLSGVAIGADGKKRNKKANGRSLNGRVYEEYPRVNIIAIS